MFFRQWLILALLVGIPPCNAENASNPPAEPEKPSLDNRAFVPYVPKGWALQEHRILGVDIDGNGTKDAILTLIEDEGPQIITRPGDRAEARALLVLLGEKDGKYRRSSFAKDVLLCASCAGMMGSFGSKEPDVILYDNGVFSIGWWSGSRHTLYVEMSFGFDAKLNQFVLLFDSIERTDRNEGKSTTTKRDFVVGTETTDGKVSKIEKRVIPIDAVKYYDYK